MIQIYEGNLSARIALSAILPRPIDTRCKPISDKHLIINFSLKLRARGHSKLGETGACTPWGHIRPPLAVDPRIHIMDQHNS